MTDIRQKAQDDRNWLERLAHAIPGFRGYKAKEERRETDKLLRDHLAKQLDQLRGRLDPIINDLTRSGGLAKVGDIDRVKSMLDRLAGRIRHASYGYSGWFDVVKVREDELDRLYEFDAGLVDRITTMEQIIRALKIDVQNGDPIRARVDQALDVAREFDEHLNKRDQVVTGGDT